MKRWNWWKLSTGVLLTLGPFAGRGLEPARADTTPMLLAQSGSQPEAEAVEAPAGRLDNSGTNAGPTTDIADAPAKSIADEKPLPTHLRPGGPVSEVIKLANSGLDQSVMLAFVTNSSSTFNLGAEDIIYLNDIGVPSAVVTAMIQRDQELRNAGAAYVNSKPAPPNATLAAEIGTGTLPPGEPPPDQVVPEPVDTGGMVPDQPPPGAEVANDGSFYDSLAPYGDWVDLAGYGWCWQPTAVVINPYWQPYYDCGHWVYSDCGWYWSSSYSWGWGPFHYGRWFHHHHLGWCWMPDNVWGPSWVSWRYGDHFCGWAPLPPGSRFTAGVGLTFHGRPVRESEDFGLRSSNYRFVSWDHFQDRQLGDHRLLPNQAAWAYNNSTVVTRISGDGHRIVNNGLPPSRVAAATRAPVRTVALREISGATPRSIPNERYDASGRTLEVYRPHLAPSVPARNAAPGKRAETSPVMNSGEAAPWLNHEALTTITAGRLVGTGVGDSPAQNRLTEPPLLLHGAQSSALRETAPRSSLIIVGRRDASGRPIPALPVPQTQTQRAEVNDGSERAGQRSEPLTNPSSRADQNASARTAESESVQRNLPWLAQRGEQATSFDDPHPVYSSEATRYQAPAWPAPTEVPRYAPSPSYAPQRSYSPPAVSAPARAPGYRPTPSAPAAARPQPSLSSSGRTSR